MADQFCVRGGLGSAPRVASPPEPVTLQMPRPNLQRVSNEYVETPLSSSEQKIKRTSGSVVTDQPGVSLKKEAPGPSAPGCSIICGECGKCRCEACRRPRAVPSFWLCRDFCLCSTDTCVDYGSCLCCVKGIMYHCSTRDGDDDTCADRPCNCGPERRLSRWGCLGLASLLLPCLCCYWPLRAVASAAESCYSHCTDRGCRCDLNSPLATDKRLLHTT